ncbi:MBL fold metallo-hydrolase [Paenibacillus oenotherae]|uniref:MBL fold metallo-hydrolase n=2 Tax=Paenibacillus oenotherae TaxID=1435645 RepID=A0ABS7D0Y7_9BACL|nr:MBL fold metallo-hydrolase [Paenibacillus oenotherae]
MLGTGSAFAKNYYNTNAICYSQGHKILLDCGTTAPLSLHQIGHKFCDIDALLVSHIHADHIGGIEEFAFQMKYVYQKKAKLFVPSPLIETLWEESLSGGLKTEEFPTLDDYFEVHLLEAGRKQELIPGFSVEPILTNHIPKKPSFSYYINDHFFYSADMKFEPQLLEQLYQRGCTAIFHDCQLTPPGLVHTTLEELLSLPEHLQELIWLMHYDDNKSEYEGLTGKMRFVEQHELYTF